MVVPRIHSIGVINEKFLRLWNSCPDICGKQILCDIARMLNTLHVYRKREYHLQNNCKVCMPHTHLMSVVVDSLTSKVPDTESDLFSFLRNSPCCDINTWSNQHLFLAEIYCFRQKSTYVIFHTEVRGKMCMLFMTILMISF